MIQPFPLIEIAIQEAIETRYAPSVGRTGGDLSYNGTDPLYVYISLITGAGNTETSGEWTVDIDCFSPTYAEAMQHANNLEALLLPGRLRGTEMIIDSVFQNEPPSERPWDDENAARVGATYVVTARRSG